MSICYRIDSFKLYISFLLGRDDWQCCCPSELWLWPCRRIRISKKLDKRIFNRFDLNFFFFISHAFINKYLLWSHIVTSIDDWLPVAKYVATVICDCAIKNFLLRQVGETCFRSRIFYWPPLWDYWRPHGELSSIPLIGLSCLQIVFCLSFSIFLFNFPRGLCSGCRNINSAFTLSTLLLNLP